MNKIIYAVVAFILLLAGFFYLGYKTYPIRNKVPEIASDTVYIKDTIIHTIRDTVPWYVFRKEKVIIRDTIFTEVDIEEKMRDYYALHYFTRTWKDELLEATSEDVISENSFIDNKFTYRILRPQQIVNNIVDNSVLWNRYLYFGVDIPIKNINYIEIEGLYAWEKGYLGVGYTPQLGSINVKGGIRLFKFR